ncbi:MAG: histidine phosphatase family protein [bacterium]|nr:histidine phosphatase family protein [bacterium]
MEGKIAEADSADIHCEGDSVSRNTMQRRQADELGNLEISEPHAIYFVRHGQPEWQREGRGIDEPCLTPLGLRQAECLAQSLAHLPVTDFYVSNLLRARQTAAPLARLWGREPEIAEWYQEIQAKNLDQFPLSEVEAYFKAWYSTPLKERFSGPPEGESIEHLYRRISQGIDAVLQRAGFSFVADGLYRRWSVPPEPRCIVLVGHTFASATALCHLLNFDYTGASGEQFRMGWGAYNKLVPFPLAGGFVWRLQSFDERSHLRKAGVSCDDLPMY